MSLIKAVRCNRPQCQNIDDMIRVGDRVKFLSDTGSGIVVSIKGEVATVEMEDGFDVPAPLTDLVAVAKEDELEAIAKIGVSDPKPGASRRRAPEEKREVKKTAAYSRYGKISLVDDYGDEEEIVDVTQLRQQYLKNMAALNEAANSVDDDEPEEAVSQESDDSETVPEAASPKLRRVEPEQLPDVLGIKVERPVVSKPAAEKKPSEEVVDLHASEVLSSTEGMSAGEILDAQMSRFDIAMSLAVKSGGHGRIVFIHGVGSGKLKYELQRRLRRDYPKLSWQDASFAEYGYGAIMVFY